MNKEAYYFSHDTNARNDLKTQALIKDYGMEGYGIYWSIIETMAEQSNKKLHKFPKMYYGLSSAIKVSEDVIKQFFRSCIDEYWLFREDDEYIWSESLLRRSEAREIKRLAKVEAGRKGGASRVASSAYQKQAKERKGKERKGKEIKENSNTVKTFTPPAIDELTDYIQKRNSTVNAQKFFDYYQTRGWVLKGGQKMKDWQSAVRTWENNEYGPSKETEIKCTF